MTTGIIATDVKQVANNAGYCRIHLQKWNKWYCFSF